MFYGIIAGAYPAVYKQNTTAALAVGDAEGLPRAGDRFTADGQEFTVVEGFEHRPEAADFPIPPGRVVTLIVSPDDGLFDDPLRLAGTRISIGAS